MRLRFAYQEFAGGGFKGIRRAVWDKSMYVKPNSYSCIDDLYFASDDSAAPVQGHRGYTLNIADYCAEDWEVVR